MPRIPVTPPCPSRRDPLRGPRPHRPAAPDRRSSGAGGRLDQDRDFPVHQDWSDGGAHHGQRRLVRRHRRPGLPRAGHHRRAVGAVRRRSRARASWPTTPMSSPTSWSRPGNGGAPRVQTATRSGSGQRHRRRAVRGVPPRPDRSDRWRSSRSTPGTSTRRPTTRSSRSRSSTGSAPEASSTCRSAAIGTATTSDRDRSEPRSIGSSTDVGRSASRHVDTDGNNDELVGIRTDIADRHATPAPLPLTATDPGDKTGIVGQRDRPVRPGRDRRHPAVHLGRDAACPRASTVATDGAVSGTPTTAGVYDVGRHRHRLGRADRRRPTPRRSPSRSPPPRPLRHDRRDPGHAAPPRRSTARPSPPTAWSPRRTRPAASTASTSRPPARTPPDASDAIFVYGGPSGFTTLPGHR